MEDKFESFKAYIYRMQGYGSMSGACADEILKFVTEQQQEITHLNDALKGAFVIANQATEIIKQEKEQGRLFLVVFEDDDPIELFVEEDINRPNCPDANEVMTAWVLDNIGYKNFNAYELGAFERFKA